VPPPVPAERLNGFTLAHQGYRVYDGYGAQLTTRSLDTMAGAGISAIAIVPYSYLPDNETPGPLTVVRSAGTENDEAVLFAHFAARQRGQFTLLKPQIWVRGSWPGEVKFNRAADWDTFFANYRHWLAHYALMAEMYNWDALCIGTELKETTLHAPAAWRSLIRMTRALYDGPLTYAANWGEECEKLTFWRDLDVVGVNCYYPLAKDSSADLTTLEAGAEQIMARLAEIHQAAGRPLWLTEIGFRSARAPWVSPHAEANGRPVDEAAQARCYEVMIRAIEARDWITGQFWWKWPSYLAHDEDNGRGYMPYGKTAMQVLQKYWK
jgi:hypothetical protein